MIILITLLAISITLFFAFTPLHKVFGAAIAVLAIILVGKVFDKIGYENAPIVLFFIALVVGGFFLKHLMDKHDDSDYSSMF